MLDINCMTKGDAFAKKTIQLIIIHRKNPDKESCNQRVGSLQQLESRAFRFTKLSGPSCCQQSSDV